MNRIHLNLKQPLIIPNLSLPHRIKYGVNSGGSPVVSRACGFLLEFIPMKIGAGMTFLEGPLKKVVYLIFILIFGFLGARCATPKEELKTVPKDQVHSLKEINLEKVFGENRGLKVLEENATTVHDYYRGGVQEKEEGERLMKESRWEEARRHLEKSNRFLRVVLKYLREDEANRNIHGNLVVIFLPNLLIADNDLKLVAVYKNMRNDNKVAEAKAEGKLYLAESLKSVRTEWADQIKKGFEDELPKK